MNYYQPMIDYLDKRDAAGDAEKENLQLPHLPWTNERYIAEYDPKKVIKIDSAEKTDAIAKKSRDGALKNINNFDVKRSYFGCVATADATKLLRNLPKKSAVEAVYKKDIGKILQDVRDVEMDAYYRYKDGERKLLEEDREGFPIALKRAIKGKSANQISHILLTDSMRSIKERGDEDAQRFRECYAMARTRRHARSLSETRPQNLEYANSNQNVSTTLENVKKELHSFTNNTEEFLNDTRYRLHLINCTLREQEDLLNNWKLERQRAK